MTNAPNPLKQDCREWAVLEKRNLRKNGSRNILILLVEPVPPAPYTGPYLTTNGWYWQKWTHHYAVIHGNLVKDECYPNGMTQPQYEQLFQDRIELIFKRQTRCTR